MLIAGCLEEIRRAVDAPVFVDAPGGRCLSGPAGGAVQTQALEQISRLAADVDGFLVFSRFYADLMAEYFGIPRRSSHVTPLGMDTRDFAQFDGGGERRRRPRRR